MSMAKKPSAKTTLAVEGFPFDPLLTAIVMFLLVYGLVMVGSASLEIGVEKYGNPFHLLERRDQQYDIDSLPLFYRYGQGCDTKKCSNSQIKNVSFEQVERISILLNANLKRR